MIANASKTALRSIGSALRFRNWRISVKLSVVMLFVALGAALLVTLIATRNATDILTDQVRANLRAMAAGTARVIRDAYGFYYAQLKDFSADPDVIAFLRNPDDEQAQEAALSLLIALYGDVWTTEAVIYDAQGVALLHTDGDQDGQAFASRPGLKEALSGQPYIRSPYFPPDGLYPVIDVLLPARSDAQRAENGQPSGPILGAVSLTFSAAYLDFLNRDTLIILSGSGGDAEQQHHPARDRAMYLVDSTGLVVVHSDENSQWLYGVLGSPGRSLGDASLGAACPASSPDPLACEAQERIPRRPRAFPALAPLADALLPALAAGSSGTLRYCLPHDLAARNDRSAAAERCAASHGAWHLVSYAPVALEDPPGRDLVVVADIPEATITQIIDEQRRTGLLIAALIAPVAVLLSLLMGRAMARPIGRLAAVARAVETQASYEVGSLADVSARGDEIGNLSRVFAAMVQAARARMDELRTIYEIGSQISDSVVLRETLEYIAIALRRAIPYDWMEICLYNPVTNQMVLQVAADHDSVEAVAETAYDPDQGYIGWLMRKREALLVNDLRAPNEVAAETGRSWQHLPPRSYLGVPLLHKGQVVGTLEMARREPGGFDEANRRVLQSVSIQAAIAVQNAQEVLAREVKLRQEIQELKIVIDEAKRAREVQAITETAYFQDLQQRVGALRKRVKPSGEG